MNEVNLTYGSNPYNTFHSKFNKYFPLHNYHQYKQTNYAVNSVAPDNEPTKKKNYTPAIALGTGIGLLLLSKGTQKNTQKLLETIKKYLEGKLAAATFDESGKNLFYSYSTRNLNIFIKKLESINNINSLKDILFMKLMYKTNFTKKIHKSISSFFEKLSLSSVKASYKKTQKDFKIMYKAFDRLDNYILNSSADEVVKYKGQAMTKRELVELAKDNREKVQMVVDAFMLDKTLETRYGYIKNVTSKLYSTFWNKTFKGFWTKDNKFKRKEMWQTFIAAEQVKSDKTDLAEKMAYTRNVLAYTETAKIKFLSGYIDNIDNLIQGKDIKNIEIINRLKWYIKDSNTLKDNKEALIKDLDKLEKSNLNLSKNEKINQICENVKETNIRLIRHMVNDDNNGELLDILNIYRVIAPVELVKSGAYQATKNAVKSFDKSMHIEVGEFFDKARDLEIGSAPTDVLTILASCGMITYGLSKAKTDNDKKSIMLKSGIPIVGAIATSLISATKLVSGSKSIALGLASGLVLNQIGVRVDKLRKKHEEKIKS